MAGFCCSVRRRRGADLTVWTFADAHADSHRRLAEQYTRVTGRSVDVQVVPTVALNTRMIALFMSGESRGLPDAVELQMSTAGPYFRPPVDHVGLLPLNHYLETTGLREIADSGAPGREGWHARSRADGKVYTFRERPLDLRPEPCAAGRVDRPDRPLAPGRVEQGRRHLRPAA